MNLRVFFYIYLFIYFVVVCVCVCVAFFALTLWYILLSFPFYSIRWFIHVIVHVAVLIYNYIYIYIGSSDHFLVWIELNRSGI